MSSSEFRGLFASVATSSKANNENAGFLTPRLQKKMTFTSSSSKASRAYNENGFVTPRNKNILLGNTSDKVKVALGDRKNTAWDLMTPLKHGNVFVEKTKTDAAFQPTTPNFKISNISHDPFSTPTIRNFCASPKSTLEIWNENLMLSEDQFNLLFMAPNVDDAPPIPSPEPAPEWTDSYDECPSPPCWQDVGLESTFESEHVSEDYELPPINLDLEY